MAALESSKNKASSILLRHGYVWNRKTARGRSQVDMDQGDTFPGRNRPIWEAGMRRRPSTSAYRSSKRTASGFGRCMWLAVAVSGAVARGATLYNPPIQV